MHVPLESLGARLGAVIALSAAACALALPPAPAWAATVTDLGVGQADAINNLGQVAGHFTTTTGDTHAFVWSAGTGRQDIGTLGASYMAVTAINDRGQVAGYGLTASGELHAFRWSPADGMRDLGTLGGNTTVVMDMNNKGDVVGWSTLANGEQHAFIWTAAAGMQDLAAGAEADDINDAGQVVGSIAAEPYASHLFLWSRSAGFRDLGRPDVPMLSDSYVFELYPQPHINAQGQIAGTYSNYFDTYGVFRWTSPRGFQVITTTTRGHEQGRTSSINAAGSIAGQYGPANDLHAFLWTAVDGLRDLGAAADDWHSTAPWLVNERGAVAGTVVKSYPTGTTAVVWTRSGGLQPLGTLGGHASTATAINASGWIVGSSTTATGERHATLWRQ